MPGVRVAAAVMLVLLSAVAVVVNCGTIYTVASIGDVYFLGTLNVSTGKVAQVGDWTIQSNAVPEYPASVIDPASRTYFVAGIDWSASSAEGVCSILGISLDYGNVTSESASRMDDSMSMGWDSTTNQLLICGDLSDSGAPSFARVEPVSGTWQLLSSWDNYWPEPEGAYIPDLEEFWTRTAYQSHSAYTYYLTCLSTTTGSTVKKITDSYDWATMEYDPVGGSVWGLGLYKGYYYLVTFDPKSPTPTLLTQLFAQESYNTVWASVLDPETRILSVPAYGDLFPTVCKGSKIQPSQTRRRVPISHQHRESGKAHWINLNFCRETEEMRNRKEGLSREVYWIVLNLPSLPQRDIRRTLNSRNLLRSSVHQLASYSLLQTICLKTVVFPHCWRSPA
ncbi:hypothetical protein Pelo_15527 [Pelomyxa schiedti]|nr:hypothetical protein Pelo_15527 [Pelomyxa schiedti]